ncbi:hypothetical protein [Larkinella humicola]|uniref:Uncharacterized protein n=1 Tax=Larkinella humicola TaxID=2607654 RepID=A0A5N1JE79_9BACT|nr:hypothetical protein [Larkinella humicola]KAA9353676.1 hypothetical protein F0P93_13660 [Larkinella humicola]
MQTLDLKLERDTFQDLEVEPLTSQEQNEYSGGFFGLLTLPITGFILGYTYQKFFGNSPQGSHNHLL